MKSASLTNEPMGIAGKIAAFFINSKLTPLIALTSVLLGLGAILLLPREEEPQIKVPMVDVIVAMPGFSAKEVEERATRPMEKLLWEIPGVEYIYSTSRPGESLVIVRFKVEEDVAESLVKLNQKLQSNFDRIPHGVTPPLIKPRSIDDVPILALTFHSARHDHFTLRRLVAEVENIIKQTAEVSETTIIGGARREVRVQLDPDRLASRGLSPAAIGEGLRQANRRFQVEGITSANQQIVIDTGTFLETPEDLRNVVVGVYEGRPVYLREVAVVEDGPEELEQYVLHGSGAGAENPHPDEAAVTLAVAKRPGANAISVARNVLEKVERARGSIIPSDVKISITRHYGETAAEKSNELLWHMGIAVVSVSFLILFILGWRESLIVAVAIPATLALTLLVFYLGGFTLNRITLFALIFSIGILVDDAIVVVENIVRHFQLPENRGRGWAAIATNAVSEVGNPTILATFAVIVAILPMAFVGGLMGPYMRPIPVGGSAAMFFSLLIAFIVTPWAAIRILPWLRGEQRLAAHGGSDAPMELKHGHREDALTRLYRSVMGPLLHRSGWRWAFLGGIVLLLLGSMALVPFGAVKVKMLPFDNKSEFQVILNMPEGSSLEQTARVAREMAAVLKRAPEVKDYQLYIGTAAPYNFNGLVRHHFLRGGASMADIQVNLLSRHERSAQSHDIVKRLRPEIARIAAEHGARVALAETPPGPPVLQTLVAEIYGPNEAERIRLSKAMARLFQEADGVVDVDWYLEADQPKAEFVVDKEKAALHGISSETIAATLQMAIGGESVDLLHRAEEREDVNIVVGLPRSARTHPEDLLRLYVQAETAGPDGRRAIVPLRELVSIRESVADKAIYHKNLMPVRYVIGDLAGEVESPAYAIFGINEKLRSLKTSSGDVGVQILNSQQPFMADTPAVKWDGEWHITLEVFRDLGTAFAAALILIYVLMVGWFRSFMTPLVVMVAIPFSLVGILPAHGAMGAFFTATSMIGFMAGAGIVVRNSIILVDFIEQRLREGMPLDEAVIDAGAVRFRPMVLTALAVVAGAAVILCDPIFQGLAISLMAGEVASLLISRMAVPVLYFMLHKHAHHEAPAAPQLIGQPASA